MVSRGSRLEIILGLKDETKGGMQSVSNKLKGMRTQFLAITAVVGGFAAVSIKAASSLEEQMASAETTFKSAFGTIQEFANQAAGDLNLSKRAAFEYTAQIGGIVKATDETIEAQADMSVGVVSLAADLASFRDLDIDVALQKIRAGLVGEAEPLRVVGVQLTAAKVAAKAMTMGLADANGELSEGAKISARWAVIQEELADANGDVMRTSESVANRARDVQEVFENLRAEVGTKLLPVTASLLNIISGLITSFTNLPDGAQNVILILAGLTGAIAAIGLIIPPLIAGFGALGAIWAVASGASAIFTVSLWSQVAAWIALNAATGGIIIAIGALIAGIVLLIMNWDESVRAIKIGVNAMSGAVEHLANYFIDAANKIIKAMNKIGSIFGKEIDEIASVEIPRFNTAMEEMAEVSDEVKEEIIEDQKEVTASTREELAEQKRLLQDKTQEIRKSVDQQVQFGKYLFDTEMRLRREKRQANAKELAEEEAAAKEAREKEAAAAKEAQEHTARRLIAEWEDRKAYNRKLIAERIAHLERERVAQEKMHQERQDFLAREKADAEAAAKEREEIAIAEAEAIVKENQDKYDKLKEARELALANDLKLMEQRADAAKALEERNREAFEEIRKSVEQLPSVIAAGASVGGKEAISDRSAVFRAFKASQHAVTNELDALKAQLAAGDFGIGLASEEGLLAQIAKLQGIRESDQFKGGRLGELFAPPGGFGSGGPPMLPGMKAFPIAPTVIVNVSGSILAESDLKALAQDAINNQAVQSSPFDSFNRGANNAGSLN